MAGPTPTSRPGRTLGVLFLIIVALYAGMFFSHNWTPKLALDLRGGTQVTLQAKPIVGRAQINQTTMNSAVEIIQKRVNGFGVAEAEVAVQGRDNIVVSIPGENQQQTAEKVGQTALLTFRPVLTSGPADLPAPGAPGAPAPSAPGAPGAPGAAPGGTPKPSASPSGSKKPDETAKATPTETPKSSPSKQGRVLSENLLAAPAPQPAAPGASGAPGAAPGVPGIPGLPPGAGAVPQTPAEVSSQLVAAGVPKADADKAAADYMALDCSQPERLREKLNTIPDDKPMATCAQKREEGTKYLLGKVAVKGEEISQANARPPGPQNVAWIVDLNFKANGTKQFGDITRAAVTLPDPRNQVAIVLDGFVVSSPRIDNPITAGNAQISGGGSGFTMAEANDLTNVLKYGALPVAFEKNEVTQVSATLGSDQMVAGLVAGGIGLGLVVLYSLLYYRGLAVVTVMSLVIAAALTYSVNVLLGEAMGLALSLPGIAGIIVAIGITADSFVIYFERLRDEVRDGRSLRSAVEQGWLRARRTIIAADLVSALAAAALYVLSTGSVRGFAFTLGLTTLIDVVVVFMFTKPLMTYLARTRFFGDGHRFSGLDPKRLGAKPKSSPIAARRRATGPKEA